MTRTLAAWFTTGDFWPFVNVWLNLIQLGIALAILKILRDRGHKP